MPSRIVRAMVCLTMFLALTAPMFAQGANARLEGAILDANGAVLTGVKLALRNVRTGLVSEATSNNEGIFRFTELPIGE
ncbi:MAG: carboxypeptidase regulatory-like domain-containing protein [Acidobacteria bacterium]|nr:carboxypeptidase regulatory-like domain-containing protein [Acidobacteriota bacterium]